MTAHPAGMRPGSSLGGARPKAHVLDPDTGGLGIAEFPSAASDQWNVVASEATVLDLARRAGVTVPRFRLVQVDVGGGRADVLVVDRFDRRGSNRVGYVSALAMLEARDADVDSYVDIAAVLEERSNTATADLAQLWRRIAFSILVSNTDDHLRNHGFLHVSGDSWTLSPAFDLNPDPLPGRRCCAGVHLVSVMAAEKNPDEFSPSMPG